MSTLLGNLEVGEVSSFHAAQFKLFKSSDFMDLRVEVEDSKACQGAELIGRV